MAQLPLPLSAAWTTTVEFCPSPDEEGELEVSSLLLSPLGATSAEAEITPPPSKPSSGPTTLGNVELAIPPTVSITPPSTGPTTGIGLAIDDTRPSEPST